jgi:hypothetical protein
MLQHTCGIPCTAGGGACDCKHICMLRANCDQTKCSSVNKPAAPDLDMFFIRVQTHWMLQEICTTCTVHDVLVTVLAYLYALANLRLRLRRSLQDKPANPDLHMFFNRVQHRHSLSGCLVSTSHRASLLAAYAVWLSNRRYLQSECTICSRRMVHCGAVVGILQAWSVHGCSPCAWWSAAPHQQPDPWRNLSRPERVPPSSLGWLSMMCGPLFPSGRSTHPSLSSRGLSG